MRKMDEYRLNRIMEIALRLHDVLFQIGCTKLVRHASDIYATAKEIKEGAPLIGDDNGKEID